MGTDSCVVFKAGVLLSFAIQALLPIPLAIENVLCKQLVPRQQEEWAGHPSPSNIVQG